MEKERFAVVETRIAHVKHGCVGKDWVIGALHFLVGCNRGAPFCSKVENLNRADANGDKITVLRTLSSFLRS